ncbi:hypothetical protein [Halorussus marinus]|uniref:hypothetical protein n=1 Tax=Halorussus marinus TaxID=2505976 RepID=UPI001091C9C0|nr:hypothetical protein [Halorussus marinus]
MELTPSLVESTAAEYRDAEPLYAVEREHVEMLPGTFRGDEYGWRDVEWVVQWYFRRHLGGYPDAERRATESAFRDNDFGAIADALDAVTGAESVADRLDHLTALAGVDAPVASAFLFFLFPDTCVSIGRREWAALRAAGEVDRPYPEAVSAEEYLAYHRTTADLADRLGVDAWTLYRALWRLGETA